MVIFLAILMIMLYCLGLFAMATNENKYNLRRHGNYLLMFIPLAIVFYLSYKDANISTLQEFISLLICAVAAEFYSYIVTTKTQEKK